MVQRFQDCNLVRLRFYINLLFINLNNSQAIGKCQKTSSRVEEILPYEIFRLDLAELISFQRAFIS